MAGGISAAVADTPSAAPAAAVADAPDAAVADGPCTAVADGPCAAVADRGAGAEARAIATRSPPNTVNSPTCQSASSGARVTTASTTSTLTRPSPARAYNDQLAWLRRRSSAASVSRGAAVPSNADNCPNVRHEVNNPGAGKRARGRVANMVARRPRLCANTTAVGSRLPSGGGSARASAPATAQSNRNGRYTALHGAFAQSSTVVPDGSTNGLRSPAYTGSNWRSSGAINPRRINSPNSPCPGPGSTTATVAAPLPATGPTTGAATVATGTTATGPGSGPATATTNGNGSGPGTDATGAVAGTTGTTATSDPPGVTGTTKPDVPTGTTAARSPPQADTSTVAAINKPRGMVRTAAVHPPAPAAQLEPAPPAPRG